MQIKRRLKDTVFVSEREGASGPQSLNALRGTWWKSLPTRQRSLSPSTANFHYLFLSERSTKSLFGFLNSCQENVHDWRNRTEEQEYSLYCFSNSATWEYAHPPAIPSAAEMDTDQPKATVLTLRILEGTEDFPLGCYPFDVWMIFKCQQPRFLFFFYLNHLKITRVVTGWIVSRYNSPVVDCTALQGAWNKGISSFGCKVSIESHDILCNQWPQNKSENLRTYIMT